MERLIGQPEPARPSGSPGTAGTTRRYSRLSEAVLETIDAFRSWHLFTLRVLQRVLEKVFHEQSGVDPGTAPITSRLKTSTAIVAKLQRGTGSLPTMQDIAGARIVVPDLSSQDAATAVVRGIFDSDEISLKDSREDGDEHGYRAIHVVARMDGRIVEVQIRTRWQDRWAQVVEGIDAGVGKALKEQFDADPSEVFDLKHGVGPDDLRTWLLAVSAEFRKADLGVPFEMPPSPYE